MKKNNRRRLSRLTGALLAAVMLISALPAAAQAAVPSGGLTGGYFIAGTPPFAYVITSIGGSSKNTVKLYQNETMQSYAAYTGEYNIPERVFNQDELSYFTVTEISGGVGELPGALQNVPLRKITIPGTVSVIGARAFAGCLSLEEASLPTSVIELAGDAFEGVYLQKLTLDITDEATLANDYSYTVKGKALPVLLPRQITDLCVRAPLAVAGQVRVSGGTVLSGGRISLNPGASLTLDGALSGAGVVEVANNATLTLNAGLSAFTGTVKLSGAISTLVNLSPSPVTVIDASGKTVVVGAGETRLGGQKDETPSEDPSATVRPQITNNYGGTVAVRDGGKTVVITPFQGYHVEEVVINGLSMGSVTRYEFQAADSGNTVAVTFAKGADPAGPSKPSVDPIFQFSDVSPKAPYAASLSFLVNNGIFQGMDQNTFAPGQKVTRAMMASLFKRMEIYGQRFQVPSTQFFPYPADVKEGVWYDEAAAWAVGTGVIPLKADGAFHAGDAVTREDLALCLYRYTHARGYDTVLDQARFYVYRDTRSLPALSRRAMVWAGTYGYLSSKDGLLNPSVPVTRAEMVEILARYLKAN